MATKPPNNSSILVAIAKLETKMDNLTIDVRDLKDGMKSDIEALKIDKINRTDAVRMQTEVMTKTIDMEADLKKNDERITSLEDSRIAYQTSFRIWLLLGGGSWSVILILLNMLIAFYFK